MTRRKVFIFWLPLFASWLLMAAEGPLISASINRLPNEVVMMAAIGIVFSVAVAIESPIINLLATSTALVRSRSSFRVVRRFTVQWMVALTVVHALVALTPLFDLLIVEAMGTPPEVAKWVRVGLTIMIPWSAAIAWRRFLQGVLIGQGYPRTVAWGTAIRLVASASTVIGLAVGTDLPGVVCGTVGLICGVTAEAVYATIAVGPLHGRDLVDELDDAPLRPAELLQFHLPLASTSALTLLVQPLVSACLARLDDPVVNLAAWPIVFQFMLFMRAGALALPEAVIALSKRSGSAEPLRRFSFDLALFGLVTMGLFAFTPLSTLYLDGVQSAASALVEPSRIGFLVLMPLPALAALVSWLRGRLIHERRTGVVNAGMVVRLTATVVVLLAGLALRLPGMVTAGSAIVVPVGLELAYLWIRSTAPPLVRDTVG